MRSQQLGLLLKEKCTDTQTSILDGIPSSAICVQNFDESRICNSHYVSHFAAFFIDARAKRSVAKSFYSFKVSSSEGARSFSERLWMGPAAGGPPRQRVCIRFAGLAEPRHSGHSVMIPPLVHQRRPCYDFYFL